MDSQKKTREGYFEKDSDQLSRYQNKSSHKCEAQSPASKLMPKKQTETKCLQKSSCTSATKKFKSSTNSLKSKPNGTFKPNNNDRFYLDILQERSKSSSEPKPSEASVNEPPLFSPNSDLKDMTEKYKLLEKKYARLQNENQKLLKDNKTMKKLLAKSQTVNMYKDIQLMEKNSIKTQRMLFTDFEQYFEQDQMKTLRSINKGKSKDSTFVTQIMEYIYPGGVGGKCVSSKRGRKERENRAVISPDKRDILKEMLTERITNENVPETDVFERCGRLNTIIGYAITTLRKRAISADSTTVSEDTTSALPQTTMQFR